MSRDPVRAMDHCLGRAGLDSVSVDAGGHAVFDFGGDPELQAEFERCADVISGGNEIGAPVTPGDFLAARQRRDDLIECMARRGWQLRAAVLETGGVETPHVGTIDESEFERALADCGQTDWAVSEPAAS